MEQFDNEFFGFGVETNEDTNDFNYDSISGLGESDYENEDLFKEDTVLGTESKIYSRQM